MSPENQQSHESVWGDKENVMITAILDQLASIDEWDVSSLEKTHGVLNILQAVVASCISGIATDAENLLAINDELHDKVQQLATLMFAKKLSDEVGEKSSSTNATIEHNRLKTRHVRP